MAERQFIQYSGKLQTWVESTDNEIAYDKSTGHFIIWGYEILACPLYPENTQIGQELIAKCHRQQKVFCDTLRNGLLSEQKAAVELRFLKEPSSNIIRIILIFRLFTARDLPAQEQASLGEIVHSALPISEYEFRLLPNNELSEILRLPYNSKVNLLRKQVSLVQVGKTVPHKIGRIPWIDEKFLRPDEPNTFYSVPAFDYLNWHEGTWRYVFQVMAACTQSIVLRIAFFSTPIFSQEQSLANQYLQFLNLHHPIPYSNDAVASYRQSLNKYARQDSLYFCQIMVASPSVTDLEALSNTVASEISYANQGALHSYPITLSQNEIQAFYTNWELCQAWFPDELPELKRLESDFPNLIHEKVKGFILRAPFLMDELEASLLFRLPVGEGLVGIRCIPPRPFYPPNPPFPSKKLAIETEEDTREISLGQIVVGYRQTQEHHKIKVSQISGHACAFGMTGAGKSNAIHHIISESSHLDPPVRFTIFEPTLSEYYSNLEKIGLSVERLHLNSPWHEKRPYSTFPDETFLRINPFNIPSGIKMIRHCSLIKSCLMAAWPLYGVMPVVLENALIAAYKEKGWNLFDDGSVNKPVPTLEDLKQVTEEYINDSNKFQHQETRQQLQDAFVRRFENLLESSVLGYCLNEAKWTGRNRPEGPKAPSSLEKLFTRSCVVELEGIPDDSEKALVMAFLLSIIYEHYQSLGKNKYLQHVLVMEESHRLLSSSGYSPRIGGENSSQTQDSRTKAIQLFLDMLAESRKLGLGLICVDQLPTALRPEVVKQANLKIMLRLAAEDDRRFLGESMGLSQEQQANVTSLRVGDAIIFEREIDNPILVHFPQVIE